MKFEEFKAWTQEVPVFSTKDAVTLSGQDASSVLVSLNRWVRAGRIERLRRGLYTLNERERTVPLTPAYLASVLVEPSYLSGVWVLSQHSVIPEAVFSVTAATKGRRVQFDNAIGRFSYHCLPERAWFGYSSQEVHGYYVLKANCEKALLDAIYWSGSSWDRKRFQQERVDGSHLDEGRLKRYANQWGDLKLSRSVAEFNAYKEVLCPTW